MPSEVSTLSLGDNFIPQSNTELQKGHKLKRRWMDAFVTSAEENSFISEPINKMWRKEDSSDGESKVSEDEDEDMEENEEHVEKPLTEPFDHDDTDDDMFDNWMPNDLKDLKENNSLVTKDDLNDTTQCDVKIEGMENYEVKVEDGEVKVEVEDGEISENLPKINKLSKLENSIKRKDTNHYRFHCDICQEKFKTKRVLTRHNKRFGARGCIKQFQCKDCYKSYKTPEQLISHNNYCSGKNYECIICHKFYPNTSQLKYHQMLHSSVDRFPCTECGKGFKRPSDLRTHERIHKDEKRFKCDVCDKRFKFSGQVIKHKTTHMDKRPFPCGKCEQSFKTSSILARHQLTHETGEYFPCNQCGIQLKCRFYLQQHKKIHNGKLYSCPVCSKSFAAKSYLKAHMKRLLHKQVFEESPIKDELNVTDTLSGMGYL